MLWCLAPWSDWLYRAPTVQPLLQFSIVEATWAIRAQLQLRVCPWDILSNEWISSWLTGLASQQLLYLTSVSEGVSVPRRSWYNHIPSAAAESNLGHLKKTNLTACCSFPVSMFPSPALGVQWWFSSHCWGQVFAAAMAGRGLSIHLISPISSVKWSPVVLSVLFLGSVVPKVLATLLLGKPANICVCPVSLQMQWLPSPRASSHSSHSHE